MLAKKYRLSKSKDFQNVFGKGKGFKGECIFLKTAKNNLQLSRFGFIVSNKVSKKSVDRHKIRRRLNDIIHPRLKEIKKGFDVVIMASPEIKNKTYQEIEIAINKALIVSKLIK